MQGISEHEVTDFMLRRMKSRVLDKQSYLPIHFSVYPSMFHSSLPKTKCISLCPILHAFTIHQSIYTHLSTSMSICLPPVSPSNYLSTGVSACYLPTTISICLFMSVCHFIYFTDSSTCSRGWLYRTHSLYETLLC